MNPKLKQIEEQLDAKVKQHLPDQYQAFKNAVMAGDKIMFDPKSHQNLELNKNPASRNDPVNTVAKGVAGLMWILYQQSRESMELEVLIVAGTVLLMHAIDFAERGLGIQFSDQMIADSTKALSYMLFKRLGISEEQLSEAIKQGAAEIQQHQQGGMLQQPAGAMS